MWESLWTFIKLHPEITLIGTVTLIQIAPIKINPWSWIAKIVRKFLLGGVDETLNRIIKKIDDLEAQVKEDKVLQSRRYILQFADELYNGEQHSREHFDEILRACDSYEHYCDSHPEFKNNKTVMSTKLIKDTYARLMEEHKFL